MFLIPFIWMLILHSICCLDSKSKELNLKGILKSILKGAQPCCDQQSPSRYQNTNDLYQYLNSERSTSLRISDNVVCVMMVMLCLTHLHLVATLAGGKCSRAVASGDPCLRSCGRSLFANPAKKQMFSCIKKEEKNNSLNAVHSVMIILKVSVIKSVRKIDPLHMKCTRNANDPWVNLTKTCTWCYFLRFTPLYRSIIISFYRGITKGRAFRCVGEREK